jgi:predicted nucleotide-binding protein
MSDEDPASEEGDEMSLLVDRSIAVEKIKEQIQEGEEMANRSCHGEAELSILQSEFKEWDSINLKLLKKFFSSPKVTDYYWQHVFGPHPEYTMGANVFNLSDHKVRMVQIGVKQAVSKLRSIKRKLQVSDDRSDATQKAALIPQLFGGDDVFIVHGHDDGLKHEAARFVESFGLKATILHEKANEGNTLIEKFEKNSNVRFAIVLLTPDDLGGAVGADKYSPRARQNVILELGYFFGKLGRGRVCALYKDAVELPSDMAGIVYVKIDTQGSWKLQLAKEMKNAGLAIDLNKAV